MGLTKSQEAIWQKARALGAGLQGVSLSEELCAYLVGRMVLDLDLQARFPDVPNSLPPFFNSGSIEELVLAHVDSKALFESTRIMKSIRARAPTASSPNVRRVMQANRSANTQPEILLGSALHRAGLRFRKNAKPDPELKCKADFVFRGTKVSIFVDGCFWHGCPKHFGTPKVNSDWWDEKIADNQRRDRFKRVRLRQRGWIVVRIWEHDINPNRLPTIVKTIIRLVKPEHHEVEREKRLANSSIPK